MVDNYIVKDGDGDDRTFGAKDVAGVLIPRSIATDDTGASIAIATSAKQDALAALVGPLNATAVTDPAAVSATMLGLLRGVVSRLLGLGGYTDGLEPQTGAVDETAPATDTASSGLNGRLQRVAQRLTSLIALVPASLGAKAAAASLAVTQSTEDVARVGIITETAPASDTASSGLNGRLQRIAQRITSLIALLPTALGSAAAASSLAVTQSTEDVARIGIITETAPASDTASSGLNGRLQRIAQRITSLIALVPAALTGSGNFKVAINEAIAAGTNLIGGIFGSTSAATGGVATFSRILSAAASTNGTSAKASAGRAYFAFGYNAATSLRYLKFYNKASAPTVGSDTPVLTLPLPPQAGFAFDFAGNIGLYFATGIAYALTTGSADADSGALTAGDVVGLNVGYA